MIKYDNLFYTIINSFYCHLYKQISIMKPTAVLCKKKQPLKLVVLKIRASPKIIHYIIIILNHKPTITLSAPNWLGKPPYHRCLATIVGGLSPIINHYSQYIYI